MSVIFQYTALDKAGQKSRGTVRATTEQEAYQQLAADGLTPMSLKQRQVSSFSLGKNKIKRQDIAALTRELSVLVEARIPLGRGLVSIAEHETNPVLRSMVIDLATMIESGKKITDALRKYENEFGEVYIETMRAAEKSGSLNKVMAHLAEMLDREIEGKQMLKRAMTYPVVVLAFISIALTVIIVFVVPKFATIFMQNGVELPITTKIVQAVGNSAKSYWYVYGAGAIGAVFATMMAWKSPGGRVKFEEMFLKIPYISKVMVATTTARFARVVSISLGSGLDLIESIEVGGRSTGRPLFVAETKRMSDRMRSGDPLVDVLKSSRYLPSFARRMLGAGKDSKELSSAADIVSRHFDRQSDHLAKNINTIIEPMMTIAMAGIVLLVALSVFMPMWEMIKVNK